MTYPYRCPECGKAHAGGPAGGAVCSACSYPEKEKVFAQSETVAEVGIFSKEGDPVSTSRNVVMFERPVTFYKDDTMVEVKNYKHNQILYKFPDGSVQATPIDTQGRMWAKEVRGPKPPWCPLWVWRLFDKKFYPLRTGKF